MKIFPLSEGSFTIDKSKQFVPFDEERDILEDRPRGSLLVEIQPFLVQTSRDLLLLDTGLGYEVNGELQLFNNIRSAGFQPEDVTKVLLSHLHKDHVGGASNASAKRFGTPTVLNFPEAKYYVQQRELDFAWSGSSSSYISDDIEPLLRSNQVELLQQDTGVIDGYIRYEHTGAHSEHHQVFWIEEAGETVFFGGDDAPQLQQMKIRYKTKYDFDADKAQQLRQKWWEQGNENDWTFLFYHDIKNAVWPQR